MASEWEDWRAICELKARYCRLMDGKDWDGYRDLFTEDYELDVSAASGGAPVRGRDAALATVLPHIRDAVTAHQVHSPEIVIRDDEADGIWAMQDRVIFAGGASISGFGHYHERYRREDGRWRIARLKLTRLHVDVLGAPVAS
ncbi:MAG: nuclear transport factor 2 family protein [Sphingomonadales bacterium]|nr:MAG: nuclear transport factor 2 family protein [Sphingomonadales bacterium]